VKQQAAQQAPCLPGPAVANPPKCFPQQQPRPKRQPTRGQPRRVPAPPPPATWRSRSPAGGGGWSSSAPRASAAPYCAPWGSGRRAWRGWSTGRRASDSARWVGQAARRGQRHEAGRRRGGSLWEGRRRLSAGQPEGGTIKIGRKSGRQRLRCGDFLGGVCLQMPNPQIPAAARAAARRLPQPPLPTAFAPGPTPLTPDRRFQPRELRRRLCHRVGALPRGPDL
jgi:hypothetical protein